MDVDRVGEFTGRLRAGADLVDDAHYYVTQAELLADLPVVCAPALHDIAHDFGRLADRIDWAADQLKNMRLSFARVFDWRDLPHPVRTPVPVPGTTVTSTSRSRCTPRSGMRFQPIRGIRFTNSRATTPTTFAGESRWSLTKASGASNSTFTTSQLAKFLHRSSLDWSAPG